MKGTMRKVSLALFLVLGLLGLFIVGFYLGQAYRGLSLWRTTAPPPEPAPTGSLVYTSRHGFVIEYPAPWTLDATVETFPTLQRARHAGGNHFQITSYHPARIQEQGASPAAPVPQTELKVSVTLYDNLTAPLAEWTQASVQGSGGGQPVTVTQTEDRVINGRPAKKVWYESPSTGPVVAVYYADGERGAVFIAHPPDSVHMEEFDRIVGSFRFTRSGGLSTYGPPQVGATADVFGTGSCLNVREAPRLSARIRHCLADGTQVVIEEGPTEADGYRWWRLRTYGGWSVEDYLKYDPGQR